MSNEDFITDLDDFLRSEPGDWNLQALDPLEREETYNQLRAIRYIDKEGRDYTEYSGAEEALGPEIAMELREPWRHEAERRFAEFAERYEFRWGQGYEVIVRKRGT